MTYFIFFLLVLISFSQNRNYIQVLGVAQDAGYPQMACQKDCCKLYWGGVTEQKYASSFALIVANKYYIFEASPDIKFQIQAIKKENNQMDIIPDGVFITHAHVGHYTGLIHFGREILGSKNLNVYTMPKMQSFLEKNGPWSQLIDLKNIQIHDVRKIDKELFSGIEIIPHIVPHRDEFSETVGYEIRSGRKKILFIPDIDKWYKWSESIIEMVKSVDIAFLDATFYQNGEIKNRDMSEIPHPFAVETISLFKNESKETKSKIHFIHMNHTNPMLYDETVRKTIRAQGYNIAFEGMIIDL
jgi:pyrroloquinoline quinone biosynthesis protein B